MPGGRNRGGRERPSGAPRNRTGSSSSTKVPSRPSLHGPGPVSGTQSLRRLPLGRGLGGSGKAAPNLRFPLPGPRATPAPRRIHFPGAGGTPAGSSCPAAAAPRDSLGGGFPSSRGRAEAPADQDLNLPWPGSLAGGVRGISSGAHLPTDSPAAPAPLGSLRA